MVMATTVKNSIILDYFGGIRNPSDLNHFDIINSGYYSFKSNYSIKKFVL